MEERTITVLCCDGQLQMPLVVWQCIPTIAHCVEDTTGLSECIPVCVDVASVQWVSQVCLRFAPLVAAPWRQELFTSLFLQTVPTGATGGDVETYYAAHQADLTQFLQDTVAPKDMLHLLHVLDYLGIHFLYWFVLAHIVSLLQNISTSPAAIKKIFQLP